MMFAKLNLTLLAVFGIAVVCIGAASTRQCLIAGEAAAPKAATSLWQPPLPTGAVHRVGWKPFAHPNLPISALACSPAGDRIASFDSRGTCRGDKRGLIRVWDARTGQPLRSILLRPAVTSRRGSFGRMVAISDDFRFAAAAVDEKTVGLWSLDTGTEVARFAGESEPVHAIGLSGDGAVVAAGYFADPSVVVWETDTGKCKHTLGLPGDGCYGLALSPDGQYLAALDKDRRVTLWSLTEGKLIREVARTRELTSGNRPLTFGPNGRKLATLMGFRNPVECFEVPTGKRLFAIKCSEFPYAENGPVFSRDGKYISAAGWTGVWDAETGKEVWRAPKINRDADRAVGFLKIDDQSTVLVAGGDSRYLRFWDFKTGREMYSQPGHRGRLGPHSVALSPDGRLIGSCSSGDCRVRVRNAQTGELLHELYPADMPGSVTWSPDGQRLYSTGSTSGFGRGGSYLHIWNPVTGEEEARVQVNGGHPVCSPDGKTVALSGGESILVVDAATGQTRFALAGQGPGHDIVRGFTPDNRRLISQSSGYDLKSGSMSLWDLRSQKAIWGRDCRPGRTSAITGDAAFVAYVSIEDMQMETVTEGQHQRNRPRLTMAVTVVDMAAGDVAMKIPRTAEDPSVICLAFSADGQLLAMGDSQGDVTIWELAEGRPVHIYDGHESPVSYVELRQSDRRLVSAEEGGTILYWDTAPCADGLERPDLTNADLARLWAALADPDTPKAFKATLALSRGGDSVVAYIREQLGEPKPHKSNVAALIKQLDSDRYAERAAASRKLAELGPEAIRAMRAALKTAESAEIRQRLRTLLARLAVPTRQQSDLLRRRRAEAVLRRIGTAEAIELLGKLDTDDETSVPPPEQPEGNRLQ
ncbi:MAG: PQQ-binding-like beta-propeller repeat protein [Pirellulaceae bacterium]|nr:PQQ-binding-like beta-propeller repeat protein [Pirellulaceae bacterium]